MSDYPVDQPRTSGKAIASLALGILSIFMPVCIFSLLAILLGFLSLSSMEADRTKGRGLAIGGIIAGALGLVVTLIVCLTALLFPMIQKVNQAANRTVTMNNMKVIGMGLHGWHNDRNAFPPPAILSKDGEPLLSWRVAILPYVEHKSLYQRFKLDEPWDSANNLPLLKEMPTIYLSPNSKVTEPGMTHYQVFVGPGTMFEAFKDKKRTVRLADVPDGMASTLLVVEAANAVPWTKPQDLEYDPKLPLPPLGTDERGFNVIMADGAVRMVGIKPQDQPAKDAAIRILITRDDGKPLPPEVE